MSAVVIDVRAAPDLRDIVHRAVQALVEGRLVVLPTETVYGLAASALNEQAVDRFLSVKARRAGQALALAIRSADEALDYVPDMGPMAWRLARRCWPGPVTLVVPDNHPDSLVQQLPPGVRHAVIPQGNVGLRVPAHPLLHDIQRLLPGPLVLSSANRTGEPDPVVADDAIAQLKDNVDLILDEGRCQIGQPSSVVQVDKNGVRVLRAGVVSEATVARLASFMVLMVCTGNTCRSPMAELVCRKLLAAKLGCTPQQLEDRGVIVMSAGLAAALGGGPAPEAVAVMAQKGLDLSGHITQPLSERLVKHADVIWTMTEAHRVAIVQQWAEAASRTSVLCPHKTDIADPIGGSQELYSRCADEIEAALKQRIDELDLTNLVL